MMRLLFLVALVCMPVAALAQPSTLGADVRFEFTTGPRITAELLAVSADSVFLAGPSGYRAYPLRDVSAAHVPRDGVTGRDIALLTLIGGGLSAVGMTAACSSLEDTSCGGVFVGVALSWVLVGGIGALMNGPSTRRIPPDHASLSRYARFPQGLPDGFDPAAPDEARPAGTKR